MSNPHLSTGLRERKRDETRCRLEEAAVEIALAGGLDRATVDAISAAANVSPRTFFNYFATKEDAILGTQDPVEVSSALAGLVAEYDGGDVISAVMALVFSSMGTTLPTHELQKSRITLARKHPQLVTSQVARFATVSQQLVGAAEAIITANTRFAGLSQSELRASAELITMMCGGAFRSTFTTWMAAGGRDPRHELQARAVFLVNATQERLS